MARTARGARATKAAMLAAVHLVLFVISFNFIEH